MIIAWQGWRLEVPDRWGPVRVEGDADAGYLLMADLHRPRMGMRWKSAGGRRFKADATVAAAVRNEVGQLAAAEARALSPQTGNWQAPLLYEDDEPPGRDIWVAHSPISGRVIELVYHAHRRDRVLTQRLLPTLVDSARSVDWDWSIFDLSCRTPGGMELARHRLNAGDLSLSFAHRDGRAATVRQLAMAQLALQRRPMERWIAEQAAWRGNQFKLGALPATSEAQSGLVRQQVVRRRRYAWAWWLAKGYTVLARHDQQRDRLVIVDATDETLARDLMDSVGWALTTQAKETEQTGGIGMFWSRKPKISRQQALAAKPVHLAKCAITEVPDGGARLKVPIQPSRVAGRLFRMPEGSTKTFELEAIGYSVWKQCDGKTSVQQIIRRLSKQYNISLRETEVSTVAFLQTLVRKGLIGMAMPDSEGQ